MELTSEILTTTIEQLPQNFSIQRTVEMRTRTDVCASLIKDPSLVHVVSGNCVRKSYLVPSVYGRGGPQSEYVVQGPLNVFSAIVKVEGSVDELLPFAREGNHMLSLMQKFQSQIAVLKIRQNKHPYDPKINADIRSIDGQLKICEQKFTSVTEKLLIHITSINQIDKEYPPIKDNNLSTQVQNRDNTTTTSSARVLASGAIGATGLAHHKGRKVAIGLVTAATIANLVLSSCTSKDANNDPVKDINTSDSHNTTITSDQEALISPADLIPIETKVVEKITATQNIEERNEVVQGYEIRYRNNIPVQIRKDGEIVVNETELIRLRNQSIETGISQIIGMYRIFPNEQNQSEDMRVIEGKENLVSEYPPDDILSEEELKKFGIRIVNTEGAKLYIRASAFRDGEILSIIKQNDQNKYVIVLVDGPVVSSVFLKDPIFSEFLPYLPDDSQKAIIQHKNILEITQKKIDELLSKLSQSNLSSDERKSLNSDLIQFQRLYFKFISMTDEEIVLSTIGNTGGMHYHGSGEEKIIFIPVGKAQCDMSDLFMYFDESGNFNLLSGQSSFLGCGDMTPNLNGAHPSKDSIEYKPPDPQSPGNYAFGGTPNVSFSIYHEFAHVWLGDNMLQPVYSKDYQEITGTEPHIIGREPFDNYSEYDADRLGDHFQRRYWRNFREGKDTFPFVWEINGRYIKF